MVAHAADEPGACTVTLIPPSKRRSFWEKLKEAPAVVLYLPLFWIALRKG